MFYQNAMDVVPFQVCSRRLEEPPVPAFIVGDVGLHLVVLLLVCDQHSFDPSNLMETQITSNFFRFVLQMQTETVVYTSNTPANSADS